MLGADIDRELRRPVKWFQRHSEPHPGVPEPANIQFVGCLVVETTLSGLSVATNAAKQSAPMANVTKPNTCFILSFTLSKRVPLARRPA
jgi:hypothetical protein